MARATACARRRAGRLAGLGASCAALAWQRSSAGVSETRRGLV